MNGSYRVIDETNFNVLATINSRREAVDLVAALLSVNDDDYLDDLTIANDDGPVLYGDSLRVALKEREVARTAAHADRGNGSHDGSPVEALAVKRVVSRS